MLRSVVFHQITKGAIKDAINNPRTINQDLVNAQQARRALDFLVGFTLSPLLWKKIQRGLSAGRVQSPALRMIAEREDEIEKFIKKEYWTLQALTSTDNQPFQAKLTHYQDKKIEQFSITNEKQAHAARDDLIKSANGKLTVAKVTKKERKRKPAAPFITSTLQQEASRKLGFSAKRTMMVAQQLYEGIEIGEEATGLITYMRTDSTTLAQEAIEEIRQLIVQKYQQKNLPKEIRTYKTKSKNAQEAHEGIRPTSAMRIPESIKGHLSEDQYKLYDLIWKRTVACQMIDATMDTVAADLDAGTGMFRANGSTIKDPGFMSVYQEGNDDVKKQDDASDKLLPPLQEGQQIDLKEVKADQHFTEPPPRYNEASLVKQLEAYGIGRPSTYASIISTLLHREYVELESRRFKPTDIGRIVSSFLTDHFTQYVDYDFTATLEDELDNVACGDKNWISVLNVFWGPFSTRVKEKTESVSRADVMKERVLGTDPQSSKPLSVRIGRYGPYAQIGTRDDEEKPKFASLLPHQSINTITFDEAIKLFELPRVVGQLDDGTEVIANFGRYGPYVKFNNQFVSLGEEDPFTVTIEKAKELIQQNKELKSKKVIKEFTGTDIQVLNGRYGPYITDGNKNARIPKGENPEQLSQEQCQELLSEAKPSRFKKKK